MKSQLVIGILLISSTYAHGRFNQFCSKAPYFTSISRFCNADERKSAFERRLGAACLRTIRQKRNNIECENNGDQEKVPFFAANFSKTLPHDPTTGLLTPVGQQSYEQLIKALHTGLQTDFNAIARAPGATMKLVNPQSALAFSLEGTDSSLFKLPLFPELASIEMAALMMEAYLMQLARDVFFNDYGTGLRTDATPVGTGSITNNAACVLQDFGPAYTGPHTVLDTVDASVVFRGNFYGSLIGPYVSQFLLVPLRTVTGPAVLQTEAFIEEVQTRPIAGQIDPITGARREFGVQITDFVAIQNGVVPKSYTINDYNTDPSMNRYPVNGRDMASIVHFDTPYELAFNAAKILVGLGFPLSASLPYQNGTITNESPFGTMGIVDYFSLIGGVCLEATKAAFAQKWRGQRALRPEAFGGLMQYVKATDTNPFNLNASLFTPHCGISVLSLIEAKNMQQANFLDNQPLSPLQASTWLLSQVYPEASPAHPSYPAGHAVIYGACITVLKAIFEDTTKIITKVAPVKPDPNSLPYPYTSLIPLSNEGENEMTVASELDKLAFNIALARNWAGIHWRADGLQGILLGEQVAIKYLQDHAITYTEETFMGFELTKVNGTRIRITATAVIPI